MNGNDKLTGMEQGRLVATAAGIALVCVMASDSAAASILEGKYVTSWIGNSYGGPKHVQNYIDHMTVQPDGTCWTVCGWDEAGRNHGEYRDGDVVGDQDHGIDATRAGGWSIEGTQVVNGNKRVTDCLKPMSVAVSTAGELMVADDGKGRHNIRFYDISGEPKYLRSFGDEGGISSGIPGVNKPLKFWGGLVGCGTDASGNIYIGMSRSADKDRNQIGAASGSRACGIRSLKPDGTLNWELLALHFVDNCDFDPASNGYDIYGYFHHYTMDYSKPAGKQWTLTGYTLDKDRYPDDMRMTMWDGSVVIRRVEGKKFMYRGDMNNYAGWNIFRFEDPPSEIAVSCGKYNKHDQYSWALSIDDSANIWEGACSGNIWMTPCTGVDNTGAVTYGTSKTIPHLPNWVDVEMIEYDILTDQLYVCGSDDQAQAHGHANAGRVMSCYKGILKGPSVSRVWRVDLPYFQEPDFQPVDRDIVGCSWDIEGDYVFLCFGIKDGEQEDGKYDGTNGWVRIYKKADGAYVGKLAAGSEVNYECGWVDVKHGLRALICTNGTYLVVTEEDWKAKNLLYMWHPEISPPPMPPRLDSASVAVGTPAASKLRAARLHAGASRAELKTAQFVDMRGRILSRASDAGRSAGITIISGTLHGNEAESRFYHVKYSTF